MGATIIDSQIFGNIFSSEAMRRVWSDSEAALMKELGLGRHLGREYAHDLVYDLCRQAIREDKPLIDLLAAHPGIGKHADRAALERMCDPASYLGQAGVMVDRVLERTAALHAS